MITVRKESVVSVAKVNRNNPLCLECDKTRVSPGRRLIGKDGLCSYCSNKGKERRMSTTRALNLQKGSVVREDRFRPLTHVGLRLRGRKFADWANEYIQENL